MRWILYASDRHHPPLSASLLVEAQSTEFLQHLLNRPTGFTPFGIVSGQVYVGEDTLAVARRWAAESISVSDSSFLVRFRDSCNAALSRLARDAQTLGLQNEASDLTDLATPDRKSVV